MEKGTKNLLIFSSIIALGGLAYFLLSRRNLKALNIYSIGKSANGNVYLFFTTKSAQAINKFISERNPNQAIKELNLEKNPNKNTIKAGTSVEVKGIEGLNGTYSVLGVLSPNTNANRVMAVLIDNKTIPSQYATISNGSKDRFYATSASNVGKLIIK